MGEVTIQDKLLGDNGVYDLVNQNFYLNRAQIQLGDRFFEPVAFIGILTALVDGKELLYGPYGKGKTTSSEALGALLYGLPLEFMQVSQLDGHPEQTEEKIKAIIDLGKLTKEGIEEVIWRLFVYTPAKVCDEINRLPEGKQNILLKGIDRNVWTYRDSTLTVPQGCFYGTCNYADRGNTDLIPPLKDRFDIAVEVRRADPIRRELIRNGVVRDAFEQLKEPALYTEIFAMLMDSKHTAEKKLELLEQMSQKFKQELSKRFSLSLPTNDELRTAKKELSSLILEDEATLFIDYLTSEMEFCIYHDKPEHATCQKCHWKDFLCSRMGKIGGRLELSVVKYARATAWLLGEKKVTLEHVKMIYPYALWHRAEFQDNILQEYVSEPRESTLKLHIARKIVEEKTPHFIETKDLQARSYNAVVNSNANDLEKSHFKHAVYVDYVSAWDSKKDKDAVEQLLKKIRK